MSVYDVYTIRCLKKIQTFDFKNLILECKNNFLSNASWMSNQHIFFLLIFSVFFKYMVAKNNEQKLPFLFITYQEKVIITIILKKAEDISRILQPRSMVCA